MHLLRSLLRPLARVWHGYPTLSAALLGAAVAAAVLAFAPAYAFVFSDAWMLAIWGVLTFVVAAVARARGGVEDDDWSA